MLPLELQPAAAQQVRAALGRLLPSVGFQDIESYFTGADDSLALGMWLRSGYNSN
jgi:hypothetical protein